MPIPMRVIEVREESERSWADAAARAVVALGRQLVKNIGSLNVEKSREGEDHGPESGRYQVEAKISLSWKRLGRRVRTAG
jgi:flavin-binding protein dodecin